MNYRTLLNDAWTWIASDIDHAMYVVIGLVVSSAVIGFCRSMSYAKVTGRCGRRVL